ncbi:MAG: UxaA family hydrolase [Firmicutes bacterium]|nr:UxaA family hydrolase [Bacillota bacterium]
MIHSPGQQQIIIVHPVDNVATALIDLKEGSRLTITLGNLETILVVRELVPRGHKVAIEPIESGSPIVKYGEQIGVALASIGPGFHVHIHNVTSTRAQRK